HPDWPHGTRAGRARKRRRQDQGRGHHPRPRRDDPARRRRPGRRDEPRDGVENIHYVPMKPSLAVTLNRADVLVLLGLEAEHGFLPALLEAARNPRIMRDAPGYIEASKYVTPIDVPTRIDRALGDLHPMGNPHINLDPVLAKDMARAIADGLAASYPEHEAEFNN